MRQIKHPYFCILLMVFLSSCIEEFIPNIALSESNKYVVSGCLNDQEGYKIISVSISSSLGNPHYIPFSGCDVKILNDQGDIFQTEELESGKYRTWIDQRYLTIGTSFMVNIITPSGVEISSDFDKMNECPEVDTIYYIQTSQPTNNPDINIPGLQFYTNLDAKNLDQHLYKIELEETWEYHSEFPIESYFDGEMHKLISPDSSLYTCWKTDTLNKIFTLSTENFEKNQYKMYPLQFVDNKTQRLVYGYSLLLKQYSLSKKAYTYWNQLKTINENEGLYEIQPFPVKGNLHNLTNPDQPVLGLFYVSSVKQKRIFVNNIKNIDFDYDNHCGIQKLESQDLIDLTPDLFPIYIATVNSEQSILGAYCVDCRKHGGTTIKPLFWPENL